MKHFIASVIGFQNNEVYACERFEEWSQARHYLESKKPCEEYRHYFIEFESSDNKKMIITHYCQ